MTYPFVASFHDYGLRGANVPIRAIVVHMAEGGGTVGFLSRKNPNGVSVHYVIEYSGRIVQMLREDHVNGSINPRDIRTTDDPPFTFRGETVTFGATAAKRATGAWWDDPNRATIGIEIEGFAKDGPNAAQAGALVRLMADIRTRVPHAHALGHRDWADYKACPGRLIDWAAFGGHGMEDTVGLATTLDSPLVAGKLRIPKGTRAINVETGLDYSVPIDATRDAVKARLTGAFTGPGFYVDLDGDRLHFVRSSFAGVVFTPDPDPVAQPDPAVLEAARKEAASAATAAEKARAQGIRDQAVTVLGGI